MCIPSIFRSMDGLQTSCFAEDDMRKKTELSLRAPFNLEKATKLAKIRFDCRRFAMIYSGIP